MGFFFFLFVELHKKVLILRDFRISACLLKVLMMKVLRLWGFPYIKISHCLSFESTEGKVNFSAVMLVRSALVGVVLLYFVVNNHCLLFFSLFF